MRETWATGLPRYSQLIICRGRIRLIPAHDTGIIHTELWGSGVYLHLHWFAEDIPPTIRDGHMATILGNIQTYNLNSHVSVVNCLHVPKYGPALGKKMRELVAQYVLTPKTYVSEDQVEIVSKKIMRGSGGK